MTNSGYWRAAALAASACVAACGGGGGGSSAIPFLPTATTTPATTTPTTTTPGAATVTLSGTATFDSVPNPSGALVYASTSAKPIRGATLEVLDSASTVVATTATDANGAYSVAVPSGTVVSVRVRAQMLQSSGNATWDVSVRDNTQSNAIYAIQSGTFSSGASSLTRDLNAPSGWGGSGYTTTRAAAPFAVLDTVYTTQAKVLSVAPSTAFPALRVYWSVNNVPASGDPALGQIGTTFFSNGTAGKAIYVLGKENVDTDEYDSPVVAHEWGHYYQASFSRDDSTGGRHASSDLLDRRVAFSEGWGNAWSGIALNRSNYTDSTGNAQAQGTNMVLSTGATSSPGWFREASIQSILWNLNQQVGFQPIHAALTGSAFKSGVPVTSIHPFAAAFGAAAPSSATALASLLTGQSINPAGNDPFGALETNSGGLAIALPMYRTAGLGTTSNACVSNQLGGPNKLGNFVYLRFNAPSARTYAVGIASPAGVAADPDLVVYQGSQVAQSNGYGTSENASVSLQAGDNVLVITDYNNVSASTCFTVTIN